MFHQDLLPLTTALRGWLAEQPITFDTIKWTPTRHGGQWGVSFNFSPVAAAEARTRPGVNVPARATELAALAAAQLPARLSHFPGLASFTAVKAYLNIAFDTLTYATRVVDTVLAEADNFGRGAPKTQRVMVEYAQPNTHHSFHIGHMRNAVLGEALARLTEFAGYPTIRAAYPGDIGLGVITVMWWYLKHYRGQEPAGVHERGQWLLKLYAEGTNAVTAQPNDTPDQQAQREAYEAERRELYRRWDAGDPEVRALWEQTREWSLAELRDILRLLDIHLDVWFFESEVDEPSKAIVAELIERGIAEDQRPTGGPVLVKIDEKLGLTKEKYRVAVVLRSDGTSLYLTKDLALAKDKFEKYHVDKSVYVVDVRQSMHFVQAFKILELYGFPQASQCYHLAYGFVTLPEGAMSSRKGTVVLFMDVLEEARRRVQAIIEEKNPSLTPEQRAEVADKVGLGAVIYSMLSVDNVRDITFRWDDVLAFDGKTAPYIQNAYVRANSILRKAGGAPAVSAPFDHAPTQLELDLIDMLARFPDTVALAAEDYKPLVMANYAYDLAKAFHAFYHETPIIQTEDPTTRAARLRLTAAVRQTLGNALRLLTIQAPAVM